MPNDLLEPRFRRLSEDLRRMVRSITTAPVQVVDEMPTFTPTGDPLVWTMPFAYVQNSIDGMIGPKRLIPGDDFTASGLSFALNAAWTDALAAGDDPVIWRARRTA